MRSTLLLIPLLFSLASCSSEPEAEVKPENPFSDVPQADVVSFADGNNQFAIDLYKQLVTEGKANENILISPYSINVALAMTYAGARGQTAKEMAQVLHYDLPSEKLHSAQAALAWKLQHDGGDDKPELHIANSLWPDDGFQLKPEFTKLTADYYGSNVHPVDYANVDAAMKAINDWAKEQTHGMIPEVLKPGNISTNTVLCLVNAIYFNGKWASQFDKSHTYDGDFFITALTRR